MNRIYSLITMLLMATVFSLTSCQEKNQPGTVEADTTELREKLKECEDLIASSDKSEYPESAFEEFQKVIDIVKSGLSGNPTQTEVNNMLIQLEEAKDKFIKSKLAAIPDGHLLLSYEFDTENDPQVSSGSLKYKAAFSKGPQEVFGSDTQNPTFEEGVKGGKAIVFANGSHLEISDYVMSDVLKNEFTISVWVKPSVTVPGNYVFSINYWNNLKVNIQQGGRSFMTLKTEVSGIDADNGVSESVPADKWTHVVVSYSLTSHTMSFYVDGQHTKTYDSSQKAGLGANKCAEEYVSTTGKKLPIMIGTTTTFEECQAVWDWEWSATPEYWNENVGFNGAMDNLQIYDIALSEGQVSYLYNTQK